MLSFFTQSVLLIFSILLQHHISKLPRYFSSQVSNIQNLITLCSKCTILLVSSLNFKSNLLVKRFFFLLNAALGIRILDFISPVHLAPFVIVLPNSSNTPYSAAVSIYHSLHWRWMARDSNYLSFFHIHFHSIAFSNLNWSTSNAL